LRSHKAQYETRSLTTSERAAYASPLAVAARKIEREGKLIWPPSCHLSSALGRIYRAGRIVANWSPLRFRGERQRNYLKPNPHIQCEAQHTKGRPNRIERNSAMTSKNSHTLEGIRRSVATPEEMYATTATVSKARNHFVRVIYYRGQQ